MSYYTELSIVPYGEHDKATTENTTWHLKIKHTYIDLKIPVNKKTLYKKDPNSQFEETIQKAYGITYQHAFFHLRFGFLRKCWAAPWGSSAFDKGYFFEGKWHMMGCYSLCTLFGKYSYEAEKAVQTKVTKEIPVKYVFPQTVYHFLYSDGTEENALQPNMQKVVVATTVHDIPKMLCEQMTVAYYPVRIMYAPTWFHRCKLLCKLWCLIFPTYDVKQVEWTSSRELGNMAGSYKGGTTGSSYPIKDKQTPEDAINEWANQDLYSLYSR